MADTIFAQSSPVGSGGVAIIRVSGPQAYQSLKRLSGKKEIVARHATLAKFSDPDTGSVIDLGIALYFEGPESFTGEDVVEYHLHGGIAIVRHMINALSKIKSHRLAEPGEFTKRAFENNKLDLTEAEAIGDLIAAQTEIQKAQALDQLEGNLGKLYMGWTERLKSALAHLEADIEFPDEDLPDGVAPKVVPELTKIREEVVRHLDDGRRGERLREGFRVTLIGAPNAGKSSLINALVERDAAIVSEYEGTTRDLIDVHLDIAGYPVIISDTAGLRADELADDGQSKIEKEGIKRAIESADSADIKLLVFDSSKLPELDDKTESLIDDRSIVVFNKIDLYEGSYPNMDEICLSAKHNEGIDKLVSRIASRLESIASQGAGPALTRERHRQALESCREALDRSIEVQMPELMVEDVRQATRDIGRITGKVDVEDLLDIIFKDFCIGK